jgi:ribosomal protein S12 methylthiotransferase
MSGGSACGFGRTRPSRPAQARAAITVGAISLGCPKNLVDTEVMLGLLRAAGFSIVTDPERAEVLLVNTCCFIAPAREESAQALAEAAAHRRSGKTRALVCAGCWPEMDAGYLRRQFPEIDALMGPGEVAKIVAIVRQALAGEAKGRRLSPPSSYLYHERAPRLRATLPWTAYLKIAEGCDHRCRFCVIPRLRGRYRSRAIEAIVQEARGLAAEGVREINLIAQDTTAYGRDLGGADAARLLTALAAIEPLHWIRLLYTFPSRITSRLIEVMAREASICKYIDVPFQHADRDLLRSMGRPGDGDSYLRLIARLRSAMPDIAIRSTFLVGLPGESERAFERLLAFLEAAQLDRAGAFCYSPEAGTPAAEMPEQVPSEVAQARYHRLMARQQAISLARNQGWVGREMEVLIESRGPARGQWVGRSFRDAPEIDGSVLVKGGRLRAGQFVRARVIEAQPYDLVARAR